MLEGGVERERVLRLFNPAGRGVTVEVTDPPTEPLQPLDEGAQRIVSARRRGTLHPAEIVKLLAPRRRASSSTTSTRTASWCRSTARRPPTAPSIVVGLIRNRTDRYPEGMLRVILLGDPTRVARLARRAGVPADHRRARPRRASSACRSSGSRSPPARKIAMDSGTENMDWVAAVLRRIVEFTQAGGEINVVVSGINVGAQPYCNAEATMLMHTRGILVMTPESAMVLTGKQALDYSGGVSAEDNFGIGGYERIMGPNGQAQYWAPDLAGACELLLRHYEHTYVAPGERFPRRAETRRPGRPRRPLARRTRRRTPTCARSARSSPRRPTPAARRRSTSAR